MLPRQKEFACKFVRFDLGFIGLGEVHDCVPQLMGEGEPVSVGG